MDRSDVEWKERVKALLKAELTRRQISYRDLATRMHDSEANINNKIARGGFSAVWFFQVMETIGCRTVRLDQDD